MIQPSNMPWGYPSRIRHLQNKPRAFGPLSVAGLPRINRRKAKTIAASMALTILAPMAVGLIYLNVMLIRVRSPLPTAAQISAFQPASATTVYSSDGILLATLQIENRRPVSLKEMSPQ